MARAHTVIKDFGLQHFGFTPLTAPISFEFYSEWINQSFHGSMDYLRKHEPIKQNPQSHWPSAQSAIVVALPYVPHPAPVAESPLYASNIALYARGRDYHHWIMEQLSELIQQLKKEWPDEYFAGATDSKPLLERDLAYRAGLGWIGKNTCVINEKRGSLFFIGEILTSLRLSAPEVLAPDRCGTCTRCLDICPTQALVKPRVLDARRCISYLTIEAKGDPPHELREAMGDWLFGCDLCQTVCPWNEKAFGFKSQPSAPAPDRSRLIEELKWILTSSGKQIQRRLVGTPLLRAGPLKLKRSALIVIANKNLIELIPHVIEVRERSERLSAIAAWTLSKLESAANFSDDQINS